MFIYYTQHKIAFQVSCRIIPHTTKTANRTSHDTYFYQLKTTLNIVYEHIKFLQRLNFFDRCRLLNNNKYNLQNEKAL